MPETNLILSAAIAANLPKCRAEWWARVGTCCVSNRWTQVSPDQVVTVLARREAGAVQIGRAIYEPSAGQVMLIMKDGTSLAVKAGAGVEQWAP